MPRPKGSKNKKTIILKNADEMITAVEAEISSLNEQVKAKRVELKKLVKAKAEADKAAAAKKAEEDKARLLEAVAASGKSIEEILELLR